MKPSPHTIPRWSKHFCWNEEEGLARCEVAVWLGGGEMAVEYGGRTPSRYDVALSPGEKKLEAVTNPRLFATSYGAGQPKLFALDVLGEGGWLKGLKLAGYAARSRRRPEALQQTLFSYLEAL